MIQLLIIALTFTMGCRLFPGEDRSNPDIGIGSDVTQTDVSDASDASVDVGRDVAPDLPNADVWTRVSAGSIHACGLFGDGIAHCWGDSDYYRLGTSGQTHQSTAIPVETTERFSEIAAGETFTCAIATDRRAWCWGSGSVRGIPNGADSPVPNLISEQRWASLTGGEDHVCGLDEDGAMWCWGNNGVGQTRGVLGLEYRPLEVDLGAPIQEIAARGNRTCARISGAIHCFGEDPVTELPYVGVEIFETASPFATLSVGENSICGLVEGEPFCWGTAPYNDSTTPIKLTTTSLFTDFWVNGERVCGRTQNRILCYGSNYRAKLGDGNDEGSGGVVFPWSQLASASDFVDLSLGWYFGCGLTTTGTIECWGRNASGEAGVGVHPNVLEPAILGDGFDQVFADDYNTCIRAQEAISCTGRGQYNALGNGNPDHVTMLTPVSGTYTMFGNHSSHSCAIPVGGTGLRCWGSGGTAFGVSTRSYPTPTAIGETEAFSFVDTGNRTTMAITTDGRLFTIGDSLTDQGTTTTLTDLGLLFANFDSITVGNRHACGLQGQDLFCWGDSEFGQLGQGNTTDVSDAPVAALGQPTMMVVASNEGTCAITTANALYCWGSEQHTGGAASTSPVQISGTFQHVSMSPSHTVAVTTDGTVMCWGDSSHGECGVENTSFASPTVVEAFQAAVTVSAGSGHTCSTDVNGQTSCIGFQEFGRLGNGVDNMQYVPATVVK